MTIDETLRLGLKYHQAGNLQQAEHIYKEILNDQPNNYYALNYIGILYYQLGNYDSAIEYIKKALELNPTADAYYNLGNIYKEYGQLSDALSYFQKALELDPNNADAFNNEGIIYKDKKEYDEAITCFKKAIQLNPNHVISYYNLGVVYKDKNQLDDAISCFNKALELNPNSIAAYYNLGNIFQQKKQIDDAIVYYQKAIQLNPNYADVYYNLGLLYQEKGQFNNATINFQRAIQINPNLVDANYCLGVSLQRTGQLNEAIMQYQKALKLNPNYAPTYNNLGAVFYEKGNLDDAIIYFQKSLQYNSNYFEAYYNLGNALYDQGKVEEALDSFNTAILLSPKNIQAHWVRCISQLLIFYPDYLSIEISRKHYYEELIKLQNLIALDTPQDIEAAVTAIGSRRPFYLACQGLNDKELQNIYGNLVCKVMSSKYSEFSHRPPMPEITSADPLRIGIVSGFFYRHSNWKIPIKGWIENLNKQRFKLFGYYTGKTDDEETEVARKCFYQFVEGIFSFEPLCNLIHRDNLHVIIYPEIGMDPTTLRLAALRLAPIQCASWGHCDTSGLPTIDYYISSEFMEPPDADNHYTEKLIRLPNLSVHYAPLDIPPSEITRKTFGLRPEATLYLCAHSVFTHLPQYDDVYPRIAQKVIDCQFLFIADKSKHITKQLQLRLNQSFNKFNLYAEKYLVFLPFLDASRYHAINCLSDVRLDTIGWSGCNSTFEALACNLPLVTLPGTLMRQRHTMAILSMIGVTETIASDIDEYVSLAVRLGKDTEWRRYISDKIAANKHIVYRDKTCITALEDFLENTVKKCFE
jgi:protein O-GlcNAc transferase